jgi:tRNA pseudouridine38/39 synthase
MEKAKKYERWKKNDLIARVRELEAQLAENDGPPKQHHGVEHVPPAVLRLRQSMKRHASAVGSVDPSKYSTRFIALKFAYLGKRYGPFEYSPETLLPSIEEELWKALTTACLIFPKDPSIVDWSCCDFTKCGRTDVGVSSFGQVVSLRVRSKRPLPEKQQKVEPPKGSIEDGHSGVRTEDCSALIEAGDKASSIETEEGPFDPIRDELQYCKLLNRLLPEDIRVYAWCPTPPPNFSARFSCRERQYRYFFTQPGFLPVPSALEGPLRPGDLKSGWLDLEAMRDAARRLEGSHDFRNFCKLDTSKVIDDYVRVIYRSEIEEIEDNNSTLPFLETSPLRSYDSAGLGEHFPKVYSLNVNGSGFLWHQIRHIVGILFLVGQRLEKPSIVSELLDVEANPRKPNYNMADEAPLVLWDCIFPAKDDVERLDALEWIYVGEEDPRNRYAPLGLVEALWRGYREKKMDEVLAHQLLQRLAVGGGVERRLESCGIKLAKSQRMFEGGNGARSGGGFIPVMARPRGPSIEDSNEKVARKKGFTNLAEMKASHGARTVEVGPVDE